MLSCLPFCFRWRLNWLRVLLVMLMFCVVCTWLGFARLVFVLSFGLVVFGLLLCLMLGLFNLL